MSSSSDSVMEVSRTKVCPLRVTPLLRTHPMPSRRALAERFSDPHGLRIHYVRAVAVRWVGVEWPGWVEVHFGESDGTVVSLADKVPIFDAGDRLAVGAVLPMELTILWEVLERGATV